MASNISLPNDPVMLLSFINTQLRDNYSSLDEFVQAFGADAPALKEKLASIDYVYDSSLNQFR